MSGSYVGKKLALVLATAFIINHSHAQSGGGGYTVTERGPDYKVLEKTEVVNGTNRIHKYTELATGMHYTNSVGQLAESREQITILPNGGAAATQGQHKVYFPGNLYNGVLEIVTPDGKHLYSRPLGVAYDDGSNTVFIATLTNAVGYLTRSNQVTYRNCFSGIKADLVCTYRRGGFESDLVFRQQPPTPGDYGLDADWSTLQMVTEFFNTQDPQQIPGANDDWFGLQDSTLKFGKLTMKQGRAFAFNGTNSVLPGRLGGEGAVPVYKRWVKFDGRKFLIEEVPVIDLAEDLEALPLTAKAVPQTPDAKSQTLLASGKHTFPPPHGISECTNQILLATADFNKEPGVVLDYSEIITDQTNQVTFAANTTYYLPGTIDSYWGITLQPGAVIKFAPGAMLRVLSYDMQPIDCQTTAENPAVLTSKDDNTVGGVIAGSTGEPAMDYAHLDIEVGPVELKHLRFYYGGIQANFSWPPPDADLVLDDIQIHHSGYGVAMYGGSLVARNVLMSDMQGTFFLEGTPAAVEHLTLDQCSWFYGNEGTSEAFGLTNSLLVGANGLNWAPLATNAVVFLNTNAGVFASYQVVNHYDEYDNFLYASTNVDYHLATNSPYRDTGTTGISPTMQAELQITTTYVPGDWLHHFYAPPDNDGLPDLGYHHPLVGDSDRDGLADIWEVVYFKTLAFGPSTLDTNGNPLVYDYTNNLVPVVPNDIEFTVEVTNQYVRASAQTLPIHVTAGVPVYYAVQVDKTNYQANVTWNLFTTTNLTASLGSTQGWHEVWVGLKGGQSNDVVSWQWARLKLDTIPPALTIISPTNGMVNKPVIQLTGFCPEALDHLTYDLSSAAGLITNQLVMITGQAYSTNTAEFTTNFFHAYDLPLTNGSNIFTLHASDKAGNVTMLITNLTLDYTGKPAPTMQLFWPVDRLEIVGSNIVCRGFVSDDTATVTVQLVDANGETNAVDSLISREGVFYAENLTLAAGTNYLTYTVTDAATNTITTNIMVLTSDLELTLNHVVAGQSLVTGTIGDTNYTVCVNGMRATVNEDRTWSANITPIGIGGGAVVVNAFLGEGDPSIQQIVQAPEGVFVSQYHFDWHYEITGLYDTGFTNPTVWDGNMHWEDGKGGTMITNKWFAGGAYDLMDWAWPVTAWPVPLTNALETLEFGSANSGPYVFTYDYGQPEFGYEHWNAKTPVIVGAEDRTWQRRTADTEVKLATGGSVGSRELNLWCISASATDADTGMQIAFTNIAIGGLGNLDTNGDLWVTLPDNDPDVITPKTKGIPKCFFYLPTATKFHPYIKINGENTEYDAPTFCVGQKLTFTLAWSPYKPDIISDTIAIWDLPGTFVNTKSDPNCDLYYTEDASQLNRVNSRDGTTSTFCWYVKDCKDETATLTMHLTFKNGQQKVLTTSGKFNVDRPATAKATPYQPDGTPTAQVLNGWLRLGDLNHNKDSHDMSFSHIINPGTFSGHAAYTQLINGGSDCEIAPTIIGFDPTQNKTWSDQLTGGGVFSRGEPTVAANAMTTLKFWDAPGITLKNGTAHEDMKYSTYLMFKPDGDDSIYVPLRLITWELHDQTYNGTTADTYTDVGHPKKETKITGEDDKTVVFPRWDDVRISQ